MAAAASAVALLAAPMLQHQQQLAFSGLKCGAIVALMSCGCSRRRLLLVLALVLVRGWGVLVRFGAHHRDGWLSMGTRCVDRQPEAYDTQRKGSR